MRDIGLVALREWSRSLPKRVIDGFDKGDNDEDNNIQVGTASSTSSFIQQGWPCERGTGKREGASDSRGRQAGALTKALTKVASTGTNVIQVERERWRGRNDRMRPIPVRIKEKYLNSRIIDRERNVKGEYLPMLGFGQ